MIAGFGFQHFMTVDAAPSRNILHDAGVGADNLQAVADFQLFDFILGAYDGQGTEQTPGIEGFYIHNKIRQKERLKAKG